MIRFENVSYNYPDGTPALRNINMGIKKGEYIGIIGKNGSGKSTLSLHLNGLLRPQKGKVMVRGMDTGDFSKLQGIRKIVGIVFQNPETQFVGRTVEEDLAFGPENLCLPPMEIRRRVDRALAETGLEKYRYHSPKTLSGGQGQCVALAGVLAMEPECLVFDEVTSMLDPDSGKAVLERVKRLHEKGKTIVYITHNLEELHAADRIIVMDRGRIVLEGKPENVLSDPSLRDLGLTPPSLIELAEHLKNHGVAVPWEKTSSPSNFAEEICRLFLKM
ncbi:cobalt transporter ATP-binding subunit [Methanosarcina sp. 2.H.T.1A.6]|uniref:energy-coupling factor transporter ATPase n=1 Tax=unclassified Methanosarcina TaxID=2644672 RepID=UPI0006213410|nr:MULTISPECIES: energy-coupling factor transporter ATPase [unclassified Methanosarcina]KKG18060.1 cobalt transporter ATP-binding subunit [Methanosarcina sp. 2.H.T.1A.3]KKG20010.1 cobalt transporter ATP-binding subunit [Methanosarcina sp. 2.H.T.1A.6]KKG21439.1 cobalt transporter ATP-binding subunit [Methanosarcina sp. 2.H.T.1A.15]KKG22674.1 cobalt transporter ATP-binding subunit [Methanosarcina sp. 2.H.T.1A.8]